MAEKPVILKERKYPISTTREDFLKESADKILFGKGFINSSPTLNYNTSRSSNMFNSSKISKANQEQYQLTQPIMRFKPRTDLERIYETLMQGPDGEKLIPKSIVSNQLLSLGFNIVKEAPKDVGNFNYYEEPNESSESEDNDSDYYNNEQKRKGRKLSKKQRRNSLFGSNVTKYNSSKGITNNNNNSNNSNAQVIIKPRVDNSQAKRIHEDLHHKTYFKALENYPLFKHSCFLPEKFPTVHTPSYNRTSHIKHSRHKYVNTTQPSKRQQQNPFFVKSIIGSNPNIDYINIMSQCKGEKESKMETSMENINLFAQAMKGDNLIENENTNKTDHKQLELLRQMAFQKEEVFSIKRGSIDENDNKDILNTDPKGENTLCIDGKEYKKTDYDKLSKVVLKKCNFTKNKIS